MSLPDATRFPDPAECPVCHDIHGRFDAWWACPVHNHLIAWAGSEGWQDYFKCPEKGCDFGRWV